MTKKRHSNTQQRSKRFQFKSLLKNPWVLKWGYLLLRIIEALSK